MLDLLVSITVSYMLFSLITYIFQGAALYKANELENIKPKWIAWIPVINIYSVLKLGGKSTGYVKYYVFSFFSILILGLFEYSDYINLVMIVIVAIYLLTIVISIQAYITISRNYNISPVWFIIGSIIPPAMIIAYIIFYNVLNKEFEKIQ